MADNKWFGTDGVRGVANQFPMTIEFATKLACAAAELICINHKKVAIAKDTRISSDMIEAALVAGFTAKGVDVIKLGVIPTPAVTTFVAELGVDMALMITASHNPFYDNGIKLIANNGDKFDNQTTAQIESLIEKNQFSFNKDKIGKVSVDGSIKEKYMQRALHMFNDKKLPQNFKVVVDCANGCFSDILPEVLRRLGANVVAIADKPDGYNINNNCGSQHVENMLAKVKAEVASLGVAVDGDGDRIKICDDNGVLVKSDQLIAFLAKTMQNSGENQSRPIVSTKLSNTALERYITQNLGLKYFITGVGERNVVQKLKEEGGVIGGEESGHLVLLEYAKSGDAMMAFLATIAGIIAQGKKPSEIFPLFDEDALFFENVGVDSVATVKKVAANQDLKQIVEDMNDKLKGRGRVVIHPSGTEPKVRVWVCGDDGKIVEKWGKELMQKVKIVSQSH